MEMNSVKDQILFTWDNLSASLMAILPNLGMAIFMLATGLLIAFLVKKITYKLLKKFKLDCAADRIGLSETLKKASINQTPSMLVANLLFWLIIIFSFMTMADSVGLTGFSETLAKVAFYIPNLIAAIVILIAGLLGAHFARITTKATLKHFIPAVSNIIANLIYGILVVVIVLTSLEQLSIDTYLIQMVVLITFSAFAVAITLSLGLGSRHQVRKLLAGYYIKEQVSIGQTVTINEKTGKIIGFNANSVIIKTSEGKLIIPNDQWQENTLLIHETHTEAKK
ncbi:mechanosensitive ion channel family protein [Thiosulfativibrio zosterae]|uniref:Small-conductance mechanosensitive channel n=1 Tax=Thiosulfativibrio zosterae TaxID=2675053 RepID=A0A6F8PPH4_9GAMM|nr:mechanosensitive ion channel [Thiosulfativibrio zosterae]BBP43976.1 membrane protein [Thiosulfativibrio zosterae]